MFQHTSIQSTISKRFAALLLAAAAAAGVAAADGPCTAVPDIYSGSCTSDPGYDACQTIGGLNGWSPMTNSFAQGDRFECTSSPNADHQARGDSIYNGTARTGQSSWWFKRGYDTPGANGAASPALSGGDADGTFKYSVWFKSASPTCDDGSRVAIIPAPCDNTDRSNLYVEIKNTEGKGLEANWAQHNDDGSTWGATMKTHSEQPLACDAWHQLSCEVTEEAFSHTVTAKCEVNGVEMDMKMDVGEAHMPYFTKARQIRGYDYTPSCRVKFQPRHANYDPQTSGFYFDDLAFSKNGVAMEIGFEPSSLFAGSTCPGVSCANDPSVTFDLRCEAGGFKGPLCPDDPGERATAMQIFSMYSEVADLTDEVANIAATVKLFQDENSAKASYF